MGVVAVLAGTRIVMHEPVTISSEGLYIQKPRAVQMVLRHLAGITASRGSGQHGPGPLPSLFRGSSL